MRVTYPHVILFVSADLPVIYSTFTASNTYFYPIPHLIRATLGSSYMDSGSSRYLKNFLRKLLMYNWSKLYISLCSPFSFQSTYQPLTDKIYGVYNRILLQWSNFHVLCLIWLEHWLCYLGKLYLARDRPSSLLSLQHECFFAPE